MKLHSTIGPAATTFTMLAEHAGVQRHTLYAHFPDERSLLTACSALVEERDPLPDSTSWLAIADRRERLAAGLRAVYDWYERNASLLACVLRDVEHHTPTREISNRQFAPAIADWQAVLGAKLTKQQRVMLRIALSFFTWRILVRECGLTQIAAIDAMVQAIDCSDET